ncbi:MAG: hypothetical protein AAFN77_14260 [Planctomycetota bacterium]
MTYARARLWLGITGVGSLVVIAIVALALGLPETLNLQESSTALSSFLSLLAAAGVFAIWLVPFDFLGGFWLPKTFGRSDRGFLAWAKQYVPAVLFQSLTFASFGWLILLASQQFGSLGSFLAVSGSAIACFYARHLLLARKQDHTEQSTQRIQEAIRYATKWDIEIPKTMVVDHEDNGFTGGIVGSLFNPQIVIPKKWLSLSTEQLATAISRRAIAINSGSYWLGVVFAFTWNTFGFLFCSWLMGAELSSVAGLLTTVLGFTVWSFLGLLVLPTLSRNASLKIDQVLKRQGTPSVVISLTAQSMDQLQDNEPERADLVETIFHPIPSVSSRQKYRIIKGPTAWNVARTALFLSWGCLGLLSRSVHCNVGRPELWTMLPTD